MFKTLEKSASEDRLSFTFDGQTVAAQRDMSVAAALLCAGITALRNTPVGGSARGPFCMMGTCFDCLVSIDGVTVQACQTPATDGLVVSRVATSSEGTA